MEERTSGGGGVPAADHAADVGLVRALGASAHLSLGKIDPGSRETAGVVGAVVVGASAAHARHYHLKRFSCKEY